MARPEREPQTELAKRLKKVRKTLGDIERGSFATQLDLPRNTLANYEQGISEPPMSLAEKYRDAFGVNIAWLVTGEGEMFLQGQEKVVVGNAILNKSVLFDAITAVEEGLEGRNIPANKKAEITLIAYDMLLEDEKNKNNIIRLVRAA